MGIAKDYNLEEAKVSLTINDDKLSEEVKAFRDKFKDIPWDDYEAREKIINETLNGSPAPLEKINAHLQAIQNELNKHYSEQKKPCQLFFIHKERNPPAGQVEDVEPPVGDSGGDSFT